MVWHILIIINTLCIIWCVWIIHTICKAMEKSMQSDMELLQYIQKILKKEIKQYEDDDKHP